MDPHQRDQYHHQEQGSLPPPPPAHRAQTQQHRPINPPQQQSYQQPSSQSTAQLQQQYQSQQRQLPEQSQQSQPPQQPQHKPQPSQSSSGKGKGRAFSFHADRGRKNSHDKGHLVETAAEKEAKRLHSKADPTLAISEAEPSEVAAMSETSLASLRSIVHKDATGNPIVEPDKSNPTRSRWERPLDTIRGFEAAIDGAYARKSMMRTDTDPVANWNRRASYQQGPGQQPRARPDSFYGSRPVSMMRPDAQYDYNAAGPSRSSVYEGQGYNTGANGAGYGAHPGGRQRPNRQYSEAANYNNAYGRDQQGYHLSHKDRSYETVTSAAASGSSDPAGYQTDPTSSDNSSIERRRSPAKRPEPVNDYGIGFSQPQAGPDPNFSVGLGQRDNHPLPAPPAQAAYPPQAPKPIPRKEAPSVLRRTTTQQTQQSAAAPEKRKSWFSRRFSKNS